MNKYRMYMIETLSNMHVGSGDTNFGVVDNLIQRHPVTSVPIIHSSGMKGALLDYFTREGGVDLEKLFGGKIDLNSDETNGKLAFSPGHLIFFEANMLTLPLRANYGVYYNCTSLSIILEYLDQLKTFGGKNAEVDELEKYLKTFPTESADFLYFKGNSELEIEDYTKRKMQVIDDSNKPVEKLIKKYLNTNISTLAIFKEDIFKRICESSIPVVARNQINDDGTSGNLFYEEILPRKTHLYFLLGADSDIASNGAAKTFYDKFNAPGRIYQFGANYSIGYGFSKITEIVSNEE